MSSMKPMTCSSIYHDFSISHNVLVRLEFWIIEYFPFISHDLWLCTMVITLLLWLGSCNLRLSFSFFMVILFSMLLYSIVKYCELGVNKTFNNILHELSIALKSLICQMMRWKSCVRFVCCLYSFRYFLRSEKKLFFCDRMTKLIYNSNDTYYWHTTKR